MTSLFERKGIALRQQNIKKLCLQYDCLLLHLEPLETEEYI